MMKENDEEALHSKEDKDFGFPFVEVKPLQQEARSEVSPIELETAAEAKTYGAESAAETPVSAIIEEKKIARKESKTRRHIPMMLTLVLMLAVLLLAMAYFLYFSPTDSDSTEKTVAEEQGQEEIIEEPEIKEEETFPDTVAASVPVETPPSQVTDVPTQTSLAPAVVASGTKGTLHKVESKGDRPSYHLIVASLPNARVAEEEAQVFLNKGNDVWMIFPTGDTKNYRLSVGNFGSFKMASDALPQAKTDFTESTWILKH